MMLLLLTHRPGMQQLHGSLAGLRVGEGGTPARGERGQRASIILNKGKLVRSLAAHGVSGDDVRGA